MTKYRFNRLFYEIQRHRFSKNVQFCWEINLPNYLINFPQILTHSISNYSLTGTRCGLIVRIRVFWSSFPSLNSLFFHAQRTIHLQFLLSKNRSMNEKLSWKT
jgi:hypothetical protein